MSESYLCLFVLAIDFDMTNILKNPKAHATSVNKEESSMSKVTIKVCPVVNIRTFLVQFAVSLKSTGFTQSFWPAHSQHMF